MLLADGQFIAKGGEDLRKVWYCDKAMAFTVKYSKCLPNFFFNISILVYILCHQVNELIKTDATVAILIDFIDHFLLTVRGKKSNTNVSRIVIYL